MENESNQTDPAKALKELKKLPFANAKITLWLIERSINTAKLASYAAKRIDMAPNLAVKIGRILTQHVERANHAEPYAFETVDQDSGVLVHSVAGTDFPLLAEKLNLGVDAAVVEDLADFQKASGTVIEASWTDFESVYAFRRRPDVWDLKKLGSWLSAAFSNRQLVDVADVPVLRLDQRIDYVAHESEIFILNKKNFEYGLNFRAGFEKTRDRVLDDFESKALFSQTEILRDRCGSNLRYLRKLSTIDKAGYYRDDNFLAALKKVAKKQKWKIQFDGPKIILTEENLDEVITLLCNNRLQSLINKEKFDIEGTKKRLPD